MNDVHEGAKLWLLYLFTEFLAKAPLNTRIALLSKSGMSQNEGTVMSFRVKQ